MSSCIICLEMYSQHRQPMILSCGHTFCNSCIKKISLNNQTVCPNCRRVSDDAIVNYAVLELTETMGYSSIPLKIKIVADFCSNISFSNKKFRYNLIQETNIFVFEKMDEFGLMLAHSSLNIFTINLMEKGKISSNSNCWSNLMIASATGNIELVKYILKKDTDVNYVSNDGNTALIVACQNFRNNNSKFIVKLLIENGADVNLVSFDNKYCPLINTLIMINMAKNIEKSDLDTTILLLENKADPNILTYDEIPLFVAVRIMNLELVMLLIKYGAEPNKMYENKTALSQLFDKDDYHFEQIKDVVNYLVSISYLNIRFASGETLLMKAIDAGCEEIANILILNGADTNIDNIDKTDAFCYAVRNYCMDRVSDKLVKCLFQITEDINKRNIYGITPIYCAVITILENENIDKLWIIDFLIENEADFNIPCYLGNTPLIYANNYVRNGGNDDYMIDFLIHFERAIQKRNIILYPPPEDFFDDTTSDGLSIENSEDVEDVEGNISSDSERVEDFLLHFVVNSEVESE